MAAGTILTAVFVWLSFLNRVLKKLWVDFHEILGIGTIKWTMDHRRDEILEGYVYG